MPVFSNISMLRLLTCHPKIQEVLNEAIHYVDFRVVCGYRGREEQDAAYHDGKSNLKFPMSKHNQTPSQAVDVAPFPTLYEDEKEFYYVAGVIMAVAKIKGIPLKWGGRWTRLRDTPHFELEETGN